MGYPKRIYVTAADLRNMGHYYDYEGFKAFVLERPRFSAEERAALEAAEKWVGYAAERYARDDLERHTATYRKMLLADEGVK